MDSPCGNSVQDKKRFKVALSLGDLCSRYLLHARSIAGTPTAIMSRRTFSFSVLSIVAVSAVGSRFLPERFIFVVSPALFIASPIAGFPVYRSVWHDLPAAGRGCTRAQRQSAMEF